MRRVKEKRKRIYIRLETYESWGRRRERERENRDKITKGENALKTLLDKSYAALWVKSYEDLRGVEHGQKR